ncbi:class I SAM-dependent methyltransferase [Lacisediminihabitans sp. FW035]
MDENRSAEQASSFGRAAGEYDRARPGYPDAAVDWMLPTGARTALDLGAGTGKFTRSLVARGLEVIAVEPDDVMRATLAAALPSVRAVAGTGESIPLPDSSVDVVTAAQAWHWMDAPRAAAEIARVLRPGGTLALVWNIRDESVDWVGRLSDIMGSSDAERFIRGAIEIPPPFGPTETMQVDWQNPIDAQSLVALVASRSYIITASPERRTTILAAVRELAASDPALAGRSTFALPYRTHAFRAKLSGGPIQ